MTTANVGIRQGNTVIPYAAGSNMPAGTIISYSGSIAGFTSTSVADSTTLIHKDGWAVCNGASIPLATYAQLYARLSTTWNATTNPLTGSAQSAPADTGTNFRIPNLQGVFLRGVGDYSGADAYSTDNDVTLAAFKVDQGQGHYHQVAVDTTGGLGTASISGASSVVEGYATDGTRGPVADGTNGTPRTGKETNPKQVGVYYLVKLYDNLAAADVYIAPASGTTPGLLERFQEGTYQPTISNQTNCETSTPGTFTLRYHRFNNLVLVFGQLSVDFINAANTTTYFDMTLPIASTLANTYDVAGILGGGATTQNITPFSVTKQSASTVRVSGSSTTGANNAVWSLFFMYQIL